MTMPALVIGSCPCATARHDDGAFAGYLFPIGRCDLAGMPRRDVDRLVLADDDGAADFGDDDALSAAVLWPTPEPMRWWRERAKGNRYATQIAAAVTRFGIWVATHGNEATKKAQQFERRLVETRSVVDAMRDLLPKEEEQPTAWQVELAERYGRLSETYYDLATGFYANAYPKDAQGKAVLPAGLKADLQAVVKKGGKGAKTFTKTLRDVAKEVVGGCPCTRGDDFLLQVGAVFGDSDGDGVGAIPVIFVGIAVVLGVAGVAWAVARTPDAIAAAKQARVDRDWIAAGRPDAPPDIRRGKGGGGLVLGLVVLALLGGAAVVMSK